MQDLVERIKNAPALVLTTHISPDGDAAGSVIALGLALIALNKKVTVVFKDNFPTVVSYLRNDMLDYANTIPSLSPDDLLIIADCADAVRTGFRDQIHNLSPAQVALIDHHPWGDLQKLAETHCHDPKATASAELVYYLIQALEVRLTPPICTAILSGIYTDTGGFQHVNTSAKTLEIAAELMRRGAKLNLITAAFNGHKTISGLRLLGIAMKRVKLTNNGAVAVTTLAWKDFELAGANSDDYMGISSQISGLGEPIVSLFLAETSPGIIRGSLKLNPKISTKLVNVSRLAKLLTGGGHPRAAGFYLHGHISITEDGPYLVALNKPSLAN